jgi:CRISPR-associated protein Cmr4
MAYRKHTYLWMTLDPVHIGTGGHRLGRVDLSIAREPGTNLPKIPGTSLSGAARSYAAMKNGNPGCAGQGDHCQDPSCPVCYTFGSLKVREDEHTKAYAGTVNLFDAHLLLFPVHSMVGPVWVTSPERLRSAGLSSEPRDVPADRIAVAGAVEPPHDQLNLGWLLLASQGSLTLKDVPAAWDSQAWQAATERAVLVSDKLFGQIVDANLEVRTSVSIDPYTGAAEEGALFTYEAIPRSAFMVSDVVEDDFRQDGFPMDEAKEKGLGDSPLDVVQAAFGMIEWLGVGGMGTRGFGRMRVVGDPHETPEKHKKEA